MKCTGAHHGAGQVCVSAARTAAARALTVASLPEGTGGGRHEGVVAGAKGGLLLARIRIWRGLVYAGVIERNVALCTESTLFYDTGYLVHLLCSYYK